MIHRIRIQNFKSLRDVTVDLGPVTVLIGRSGSGKTNFAEALKFVRSIASGELGANPLQSRLRSLNCATSQSNEIGCEVHFTIPGLESEFRYSFAIMSPEGHLTFERLYSNDVVVFSQSRTKSQNNIQGALKWDVAPSMVSPPEPGKPAINRLPGIEDVALAYSTLSTGIGVYAFPFHVMTSFAETSKEVQSNGLDDAGKNYLRVMREVAQSLHQIQNRKGILASLRTLNASIASVDLDSLQNPRAATVGHFIGGSTLVIDLASESDGFRRFYAHLLALYQTPPKQTLVFEEPENGIFPGALSLLADEFKAAPDAGRGQVIITTHSPQLLDHFDADQIRVVELENLETKIGQLADGQREALEQQLLSPGELLTVDTPIRAGSGAE